MTATTSGAAKAPRHRRGEIVTERILAAALAELGETDGALISVDRIADRAGVNKTTVYRRWPTLDELLLAAVTEHADDAVPLRHTDDLRADLVALCGSVAANLGSPTGRSLTAAARRSPELDELRRRFWSERMATAAERISGPATLAGLDPLEVIEWLVGPIHFRITERGEAMTDERIERLVDSVLGRLGAD